MDTWKKLVGNRAFISDLGKSHEAEIGGTKTIVGRYAVWVPVEGSDQVIEVSDDLDALQQKYGVPIELVLKLGAFAE